ncbi:MAG: hypothetical protein ACFB0G_12040 [Leptolyngbyaceae cyanobacterium]
MSNFLTHLIAREQQALPAVKPRPIARFESAPAQGIELVTFTEQGAALETHRDAPPTETTSAALPPTFAPPSAGHTPVRDTSPTLPVANAISPQATFGQAPVADAIAPPSALGPPPSPVASSHRPAPWYESRADMAQPAGERSPRPVPKSAPVTAAQQSSAQAAPLPPSQPAQSQERGASSAGDVEIQIIERQTIERSVSPPEPIAVPTPRAITPAMEHGERSAVRPRVALARDQAEQRAAFTPPAPPPAPTINVTIGRIEIKASPPARSPRRSPPPPAPVMTLETYLQQRTGGQ